MKLSFPSLLTLLFIALRLTDVIAWSWLWVLSPIWISVLIAVAVFVGAFIYAWRSDVAGSDGNTSLRAHRPR